MWFKNKFLNYPTAIWGVFITGVWVWFSMRFQDNLSSFFVNFTYIGFGLAIILFVVVVTMSRKSKTSIDRTNR
jgi:hypothetical protein